MNSNFNEPFDRFNLWLQEASSNPAIIEPTAMCLSTADKEGSPSSRMVLLKKINQNGFYFFTNLTSRKAGELAENTKVALCFYWAILGKQIRIEGRVKPASNQEADEYFASRRHGSQIGAWASKQSSEMSEWKEFEDRINEFTKKFEGQEVPRPPFWSGFAVQPNRIEFWQEGEFRIHKREVYKLIQNNEGWVKDLLYP